MIGIVGGVGPFAGVDLLTKVFENSVAKNDQEYPDVALISLSSKIKDRTDFLLGEIDENPAYEIVKVITLLAKIGATVVGIPCNTVHSERIFSVIQSEINNRNIEVTILNMVDQTIQYIKKNYPKVERVGVLSTTGTYKSKVYLKALKAANYTVVVPSLEMQENIIHPSIYDPVFGIKSTKSTIHPQARQNLLEGIIALKEKGAQLIILGCTEIPIAIKESKIYDIITIDPTKILARELINKTEPQKLKSI